jgi:hypothetical protein
MKAAVGSVLISLVMMSAPLAGQPPQSADSAARHAFSLAELRRESVLKWVRADSGSTHRAFAPVIALAIVGAPLGVVVGGLLAPRSHCPSCGATSGPTRQAMIIGGSVGTVVGATIGWIFFGTRHNSSGP